MTPRNIVATLLEATGVIIATVSLGALNPTLGGCVLAAGLVCFGIALEEDDR